MEHERLLIFNRMQIDWTRHPSRCVCMFVYECVCLYILISSSPFRERRKSLHGFICFGCFLLVTFVISPPSPPLWCLPFPVLLFASSSFSSSCSSSSPSSLSFFRIVRNLGKVWPVICCFAVLFHCGTHQALFSSRLHKCAKEDEGCFFFSPLIVCPVYQLT